MPVFFSLVHISNRFVGARLNRHVNESSNCINKNAMFTFSSTSYIFPIFFFTSIYSVCIIYAFISFLWRRIELRGEKKERKKYQTLYCVIYCNKLMRYIVASRNAMRNKSRSISSTCLRHITVIFLLFFNFSLFFYFFFLYITSFH